MKSTSVTSSTPVLSWLLTTMETTHKVKNNEINLYLLTLCWMQWSLLLLPWYIHEVCHASIPSCLSLRSAGTTDRPHRSLRKLKNPIFIPTTLTHHDSKQFLLQRAEWVKVKPGQSQNSVLLNWVSLQSNKAQSQFYFWFVTFDLPAAAAAAVHLHSSSDTSLSAQQTAVMIIRLSSLWLMTEQPGCGPAVEMRPDGARRWFADSAALGMEDTNSEALTRG